MKTIIVPTDFSKYADNALDFAKQLAPKLNAMVLLLHTIDLPPLVQTLYMENYSMDDFYEEAKKQAEEKLGDLRQQHKEDNITSAVFRGRLYEVINEIYGQFDAELIIMGTKGASGLKETFMGSNTEKVIRNSRIPVLSIQNKVDISSIRQIVIPTNGKEDNEGFFSELQKLQQIFNTKNNILFINALHAFENENEVKENLMKYAKKAKLENYEVQVLRAITPEDGIADFVDSNNVDMIAIATHGRHGLSHLMYGSLAEDLANHISVPVFSYNLKADKYKAQKNENKEYSGSY
ncbi:MAG: universal stress protein [Candidatus Cyclobacteriaceae bacterium M2_1C_046]